MERNYLGFEGDFFLGIRRMLIPGVEAIAGSPRVRVDHENMNVAVKVQIILVTPGTFPGFRKGWGRFRQAGGFPTADRRPRVAIFWTPASLPNNFLRPPVCFSCGFAATGALGYRHGGTRA
jgi:hypothetical protein